MTRGISGMNPDEKIMTRNVPPHTGFVPNGEPVPVEQRDYLAARRLEIGDAALADAIGVGTDTLARIIAGNGIYHRTARKLAAYFADEATS